MSVTLRRVEAGELGRFAEAAFRFYVTDLVAHAGMSREAAEEKARRDQADLLAGRPPGPGQHLFWIEEDGRPVGRLWFAEREGAVWLFEIDVDEAERGRGLGREGMRLFEEEARRLGAGEAWLNVSGGNAVARGLYGALGYAEASVHMSKQL